MTETEGIDGHSRRRGGMVRRAFALRKKTNVVVRPHNIRPDDGLGRRSWARAMDPWLLR